jgi:hypothetical protein
LGIFGGGDGGGGSRTGGETSYHRGVPFPIKVCVVCSEEFELKPDKPGFANRCPECSAAEADDLQAKGSAAADTLKNVKEVNEARKKAIRDLLYRKDS